MALNATVGGGSSDSYVADVAEALSLCDQIDVMVQLGVSTVGFRAANSSVQEALLRTAALSIDQLGLMGMKADEMQSLEWPRVALPRRQDWRVVPSAVKLAQVVEACSVSTARDANSAAAAAGISSYTVGEESVSFRDSASSSANAPASAAAESVLNRAGLVQAGTGSVYTPRG